MGDALREEYKAIVDAGFLLQIDDPFLSDIYSDLRWDAAQREKKAALFVEALNHALRGIPEDKVRFHTCYGINEGPRIFDAELEGCRPAHAQGERALLLLRGRECAARARVPRLGERTSAVRKGACAGRHHARKQHRRAPGADRRASRRATAGSSAAENVIASADCGFSSQACYKTEVHPKVIWEKFKALAEGARLATKKLWA